MVRPYTFDEIIGQRQVVENLKINCQAAKARKECIPHLLLAGGSGLGKTTLALAVANELGANCHILNGPNLKSPLLVIPTIAKVQKGDIIFIDEIHRMHPSAQETLYHPMEDSELHISNKEGSLTLKLPPFMLFGATTNPGRVLAPLRNRFILFETLQPYSVDELTLVVKRNVVDKGFKLTDEAATYLASASRGVPRTAINYIAWLADVSEATNIMVWSVDFVRDGLSRKGVDGEGLNQQDRAYLSLLQKAQTPLGLKTIAESLNLSTDYVEEVIEPGLLKLGKIQKTPKGRLLWAC